MATALSATGRITLSITVSGLVHKVRVYVRNPTFVTPDWFINSRTLDENDINWTDAAEGLAYVVSYMYPSAAGIADAVLEERVGILWFARAFHTVTLPNKNGSVSLAQQATLVMRDVLFNKVKLILLDINLGGLDHTSSFSALGGNALNMITEFTSGALQEFAPYVWMVGRSDQYLNVAPFVGWTLAPNRKVRRARGLT